MTGSTLLVVPRAGWSAVANLVLLALFPSCCPFLQLGVGFRAPVGCSRSRDATDSVLNASDGILLRTLAPASPSEEDEPESESSAEGSLRSRCLLMKCSGMSEPSINWLFGPSLPASSSISIFFLNTSSFASVCSRWEGFPDLAVVRFAAAVCDCAPFG